MLSDPLAKNNLDLKIYMDGIIHQILEIEKRFKFAEPLESVKDFGLPLGSKKYPISGTQFMLCGDASSLINPFSGEGIETAMASGLFAAEMAMECFKRNDFSANLVSKYDEGSAKKWELISRIIMHYNGSWVNGLGLSTS